jgi:tRNA-splicing ligase RtcB (3'-phosphate/5'-hydroxy nucleic acid ligase)
MINQDYKIARSMTYGQFPVRLNDKVAMWAHPEDVEEQALQQIKDVSELPGLHGIRVMPDVHFGKGATVGSVIAMENALAPAAVGVDIGCGVNAVRTNLTLEDLDGKDLKELRKRFEKEIPVGFNSYQEPGSQLKNLGEVGKEAERFLHTVNRLTPDLTTLRKDGSVISSDASIRTGSARQLGTLGGGNHFIELCKDSEDRIWITLHSGSRNIGNVIAQKHIDVAMKDPRNKDLPKHLQELSLFYKETPEMDAYLHDLNWAQEFAMRSRTVMMEIVKHQLEDYFEERLFFVEFDEEINCHHNYVAIEEIDGKEMIVTRKGAISAKEGERALIPGSMATGSYIVRGLGNPLSFQSASHGAGRKLSRKAAIRTYSVEDLQRTMKGIEARTDEGVLDEISLAYKDLDAVVAAESDLVKVEQKLDTILCVKG